MILPGFATGESSFTFESFFLFALGASFFAAARTFLKWRMKGSPWASGQRCAGIASSARVTSSTSSPWTMPRRSLSKRQIFIPLSEDRALQRRIHDFAAQRGKAPGGGLRVEAEAEMAGEGMRVAEDALER